ncbi:DUF4012 domain-containing protein, partial [Aeromicrobium sp.]|uniref:DUF4012 domain-containing protein n=1 Tax=Aeromicrobium sp. TaxID=1871063 RepID=UPI00198B7B0C
SKVPYFGRNVGAVQTVSSVMDDVATKALPPIVNVSGKVNVNAFSPRDGKIDLSTINEIAPSLNAASRALTSAQKQLRHIDAGSLLLPLRGPVSTIQYKIESARSAASAGDLAARLMPTMLGQNETRRYLLLIQNNAETRATGGISGSFALITAKRGKLTMGRQGSNLDLKPFAKPVVQMTNDEKSVFTDQLVRDLRDSNVTPHFPRTGEITAAMARKSLGVTVDGVISVDPIALSQILGGTGPVTLADKTVLDQTNAVEMLLNTVYLRYQDNEKQDAVLESAARSIFDVIKAGTGQSRTIISGMVLAANENRLMLWSSHPDEQREIAPTGLSGVFSEDGGAKPHVGVYFGDGSSTKMEYYLDYSTLARSTRCLVGGAQAISTNTQLVSNAPTGLPLSVTGDGSFWPRGEMRIYAWLYAPHGGRFLSVRVDGVPQVITSARLRGRAETTVVLTIKPGEAHSITTTMISGRDQRDDGVFSTTPGVRPTLNDVPIPSACS